MCGFAVGLVSVWSLFDICLPSFYSWFEMQLLQ
jgi:hypothetical protein